VHATAVTASRSMPAAASQLSVVYNGQLLQLLRALSSESIVLFVLVNIYLRQVNEVNGGDNVFVRCLSVFLSVCLSVCVCAADRSIKTSLKWTLNTNSSKTVIATDFKCFPGQSGHDPLKTFKNGSSVKIHLAEICTLTSS